MYKKTDWERCVEFHGHECMGLAIGFRTALLAMEKLGVIRSEDEELFSVVENDACGVDAIQVLTGCTLGKGNLIYKDTGKQAVTLASRKSGKAVRLLKKAGKQAENEKLQKLRQRIAGGKATAQEKDEWQKLQQERIQSFLAAPPQEILAVKQVEIPQIERARLFGTVICSQCGEPFAESKAGLAEGRIFCKDCLQAYTRGW